MVGLKKIVQELCQELYNNHLLEQATPKLLRGGLTTKMIQERPKRPLVKPNHMCLYI
jgi:hypothetical protein